MRPYLAAGLVLLLSAAAPSADEPQSAPTGPAARKLDKLKKKFEAEEKEIKKKLADAQDGDDRKQAQFQLKELSALTASDAVEIAQDHPKEAAAVDAAVFALKLLGEQRVTGGDMDKAMAFLLENHVNSPKLQDALAGMHEAGPAGRNFLKTVAEKTTSTTVQAVALYYSALALDAQAGDEEDRGNDEGAGKIRAEAIATLEKAAKLAPAVKVGERTLAKAVEAESAAMRIGVGNLAPDVEGVGLDGAKVKLSSYRGKVVLFDFWATWCGPCVKMIPHERELAEKLAKKPFALLSVSADEEQSALTEFLGMEKMPWNHWWDGKQGPLAKTFRIRAYPTLYLIDAKGVLRKKWVGSPGDEVLDKAVAELVAEAEKEKR
jgi:thiol-disulfide isomerase/thioredoxin